MTFRCPRFFTKSLLSLVLAVVALPAFAADFKPSVLKPTDSPEAVLRESYRRLQAGDWNAAAEAFDPAALKQFREMLAPVLEASEGAGLLALFFDGQQTPESLKAISDQAFFSKMVENMMKASGGSLEGQEVLGGVAEGADRMHMVVRSKASTMGLSLTEMEVVTLNKTPNGWRLALSGKMEGMAQALQLMRSSSTKPGRPGSDPRNSGSSSDQTKP